MNTPNNPNSHPFNIEYLKRTMTAKLSPQPGHDRPRSSWDHDERFDRLPKTASIQVLFVRPGEVPELLTLENELGPMRDLIGGTITTFETGVEGTVGVAHDEAVLLQMPPNRFIESTGALIFGPFFVASSGVNFHSLSEEELEAALDAFVPPLTVQQVQKALRASAESEEWIERELRDVLGE